MLINQLVLTDKNRISYPTATTCSSQVHMENSAMINRMLSHKKNLSNFKETEIMYSILFNHNGMN